MSEVRVGISGWAYKEWRGGFYPRGLAQKRELEYASERLNSIEINGTFYRLQKPESFRKWADETPDNFLFALKGSKFITHQKRLKEVRIPLANFFASGPLCLGKKLGPILWQFAPWERFDADKMEEFLSLLPRTAGKAAELAAENTIKLPKNAWTTLVDDVDLKYAFEPRHESFFTRDFIALLRKHNAALAFADSAEKYGYAEDVTADFVYIRLHGKDELYTSDYSEAELKRWAKRIKSWQEGTEPKDAKRIVEGESQEKGVRDVYVYFDNSIKGHAPLDAIYLAERLGIKSKSPAN